jgi:hypothetical protein
MSTKSKEWQEFKRVREDILSEFTTSDAGAIRKKWAKDCLMPLGYNHEFDMLRCKERPEDDKATLYAEWTQMFKDGKFNPDKKTARKKTKPKRGSSLDDLTLDEKDDSPDLKHDPSFTKEQLKELGDEPATQPEPVTKQPKIIDKLNKKNVDAMKKHKEELTMASTPKSKSKKELLLEAISALEEEENTGITEEQVEKIAMRVVIKVLTDLNNEVSAEKSSLLRNYIETHEAIEECSK